MNGFYFKVVAVHIKLRNNTKRLERKFILSFDKIRNYDTL